MAEQLREKEDYKNHIKKIRDITISNIKTEQKLRKQKRIIIKNNIAIGFHNKLPIDVVNNMVSFINLPLPISTSAIEEIQATYRVRYGGPCKKM